MTESNGLRATVEFQGKQIDRLWEHKASKDSVVAVTEDVKDVKEDVKEIKSGFRNLQISILAGCVVWALGSAGFLIGVLTLHNP